MMADYSAAIVTFNCAREIVDPDRFAADLLQNTQLQKQPDFVFLSLQEVAPIAHSFLGGSFLNPYLAQFGKAVRVAAKKLVEQDGNNDIDRTAGPADTISEDPIYMPIEVQNVGMTACILFVRNEHVQRVRWVETAGTGLGYLETGNKGCVGIRIGFELLSKSIVPLTFLAAHLAPGEAKRERRNADWRRVVEDVVFVRKQSNVARRKGKRPSASDREEETEPLLERTEHESFNLGVYGSRSLVFFAGDLNYRTSNAAPTPTDAVAFPQPKSLSDFESFEKLFRTDQLTMEHRANHVLQGFHELPVTFPPTYKYARSAREAATKSDAAVYADPTHSVWAKWRWPSWCDRVWMLDEAGISAQSAGIKTEKGHYRSLPLLPSSDHQAVSLYCEMDLDAISAAMESERGTGMAAPYAIRADWQARRRAARRLEIAFGLMAYFSWTWEGNALVLATLAGAWGGWTLIQLILEPA